MKKTLLLLCSLLFFSLHSSAQVLCIQCYNQNARVLNLSNDLIINGGFENTTCIPTTVRANSFCPNSSIYNCDINNWKCSGGGFNTYAHICDTSLSKIVEGIKAAYFGNNYCNSCSSAPDDLSCLVIDNCQFTNIPAPVNPDPGYGDTTGVRLEQTVNGLVPGRNYVLEFWAGGERGFYENGLFAVNLGFGNIFLRDPPTPNKTGIGIRYIIVFTTTSASHTIKFTNWGHIDYGFATELILDDVQLFSTSEGGDPCATGINEHTEIDAVSVFPNPATNLLTITTNTNEQSEIILYDIASRKLMQEKFNGSVSLNIENLAKGIYLYEVRDGNGGIKKGKVVKN